MRGRRCPASTGRVREQRTAHCVGGQHRPVFALFGARNIAWYGAGMVLAFGVIHAWFYGAQGTLYASLFPTRIRYTGLSTVYQLSGIYASGLTPLILVALIRADHGSPWYACGYLVATAVISVGATVLLKAG